MAIDISKRFQELCPNNDLRPNQFGVLSKLFCEAVRAENERYKDTSTAPWTETSRPSILAEDDSLGSPKQDVGTVDSDMPDSNDSFLAAAFEAVTADNAEYTSGHGPQKDINSGQLITRRHITPLIVNSVCDRVDRKEALEDINELDELISRLPVYEEAEKLVDIFFRYLESNWYYFDEYQFRDEVTQLYQGTSVAIRLSCSGICQIFLVLALASSFAHLDQPTPALEEIPGAEYFKIANKLMPAVISQGSLESVQCCLLTSLYVLPTRKTSCYYTYLGLALRLAIGLSLHRKSKDRDISLRTREIKTRVFWTTYCIECRVSTMLGLPVMLQKKDIDIPLPSWRQDLDEINAHKLDRLIAFTQLTLAMNRISEAGPLGQSPDRFTWASSILESWKSSLPSHVLDRDGPSLRVSAHLEIMYNMIWIYFGRTALLSLVRRRVRMPRADNLSEPTIYPHTKELAEKATTAAKTVIKLINLLYNHRSLAKFSFSDLHSCSSAIIILLLDEASHPATSCSESCSSLISTSFEALRFIAQGNSLASDALTLVERFQAAVQKYTMHTSEQTRLSSLGQEREQNDLPQHEERDHRHEHNPVPNPTTLYIDEANALEYTTSDFAPFETSFFAEIESSLLEYPPQDLMLLGFDGFRPTFGADELGWN
ncbi:Nn.00g000050.m01.CDS01 [Neocucurbitaria sp. VM-36]